MKKIGIVVVAAVLFGLGTLGFAQTPRHVAVHAGHLLDVKTGKLLADQTVVIEDGRIISTGAAAEAKIPADAVRIDLPNATVLPGLIDAHTHLTMEPKFGYDRLAISVPREALIGARNARVTLLAGFTTVRNVGASGYSDVALRDAINAGDVPGPRMLVSGPPLSITGGHCDNNMLPSEYHAVGDGVADGIAAVQHKVRENIKYGADLIKVCATGGVLSLGDNPQASQYTLEEMKAIVADAHRLGRKVAAHAHGAEGIRWAAEAGVDSIEHGSYIDDARHRGHEGARHLSGADALPGRLDDRQCGTDSSASSAAGQGEGSDSGRAQEHCARVCQRSESCSRHGRRRVSAWHECAMSSRSWCRLGLTPLQAIQAGDDQRRGLAGVVGEGRKPRARGVGRHRRGGWGSDEGRYNARAGEVRDEGRRGGEERVWEVGGFATFGGSTGQCAERTPPSFARRTAEAAVPTFCIPRASCGLSP